MKKFEIYSQNSEEKEVNKDSGPLATVEAINEIEALKKWHLHLLAERSSNNYFNNICYCAIDTSLNIYKFLDTFKKSSKKYNSLLIITA